mmetsp:Transcript_8821/g.26116  ORF Transcript_8821/g.26116 Transcript_8821/m.26116 type:complete len:218 (+) Transcript_8821:735-1388(+)
MIVGSSTRLRARISRQWNVSGKVSPSRPLATRTSSTGRLLSGPYEQISTCAWLQAAHFLLSSDFLSANLRGGTYALQSHSLRCLPVRCSHLRSAWKLSHQFRRISFMMLRSLKSPSSSKRSSSPKLYCTASRNLCTSMPTFVSLTRSTCMRTLPVLSASTKSAIRRPVSDRVLDLKIPTTCITASTDAGSSLAARYACTSGLWPCGARCTSHSAQSR